MAKKRKARRGFAEAAAEDLAPREFRMFLALMQTIGAALNEDRKPPDLRNFVLLTVDPDGRVRCMSSLELEPLREALAVGLERVDQVLDEVGDPEPRPERPH